MSDKESDYLEKYRMLMATRHRIAEQIREFRHICKTLENWPKTAADIVGGLLHDEWAPSRLAALPQLRLELIEYDRAMRYLADAWRKLDDKEKIGLCDPTSARPPEAS